MAYDAEEGLGESRAELRNGVLCSLIANVNRDEKKQPTPFQPKDFIIGVERKEKKKPTTAETEAHLSKIFGK